MKRIGDDNQWREASWEEVQDNKYFHARQNAIGMGMSPTANDLALGVIQR